MFATIAKARLPQRGDLGGSRINENMVYYYLKSKNFKTRMSLGF